VQWIAAILAQLLTAAASWAESYLERQKAIADDWAARSAAEQLRSMKASQQLERDLVDHAAAAPVPATPTEWNAIARRVLPTAALLAAAVALGGCGERTVYVHERMPLIQVQPRPVLPEAEPFTAREHLLVEDDIHLRALIAAYNDAATAANAANGY
jgi:hypothetical protein